MAVVLNQQVFIQCCAQAGKQGYEKGTSNFHSCQKNMSKRLKNAPIFPQGQQHFCICRALTSVIH